MNEAKIFLIQWKDVICYEGWKDAEEIGTWGREETSSVMETIGYLLKDNNDYLIISPH